MSKFFVHYEQRKAHEDVLPDLRIGVHQHYTYNSSETSNLCDFVRDFARVEYLIYNQESEVVAAFVMTINEDMHLGNVACYPVLFVTEDYRNNREIAKLIRWYSNRFAKTFGAGYIAKTKHISKFKRIETFKEVQ